MFIGRQHELEELNRLYGAPGFQMPVIYGRRRVGKTTLIREFAKGKKCIYYTAIEATGARNLTLLSKAIYKELMPGRKTMPEFRSYEDALQFIYEEAEDQRLILVIDEYPYLARSERSMSSVLQRFIDEYYQQSSLLLVLCGSSMSFMENQVLGYQSPLYGRRTAQFLIRPFDYRVSAEFVPAYSPEEKAIVYGITGGTPKYLELIDLEKSLRQNIIDLFLNENGYLFEEPSNFSRICAANIFCVPTGTMGCL